MKHYRGYARLVRALRIDMVQIPCRSKELLIVLLFPGYNRDKAIKIALNLLKTFDGNLIDLFTAAIHELT